jgi:hypothetical protein
MGMISYLRHAQLELRVSHGWRKPLRAVENYESHEEDYGAGDVF